MEVSAARNLDMAAARSGSRGGWGKNYLPGKSGNMLKIIKKSRRKLKRCEKRISCRHEFNENPQVENVGQKKSDPCVERSCKVLGISKS